MHINKPLLPWGYNSLLWLQRLLVVLVFPFMVLISGCGSSYTREVVETHPDGSTHTIHYYKETDEGPVLYKLEEFFDNGIKRVEGYFRDGERHGRWNSWHDNGKVWSIGRYDNGQLHGKQTVYYPNGEKFYEGEYEHGIRVGLWRFWNEQGGLENERTYE
jgi:antitoxin component YwqK of YwqJK toxin-antitoxin module